MKLNQTVNLVQSAMILAAGRGERMRPLTEYFPKPMLPIHGKPMMQYHLEALKTQGFSQVVINHAWLGDQIESHFGAHFSGLDLAYSREETALETAGGIASALHLMPFLSSEAPYLFVINGDVVCHWRFEQIQSIAQQMKSCHDLAYLVMIPNPPHHPEGDFVYSNGRLIEKVKAETGAENQPYQEAADDVVATFAGIGIYHRDLFASIPKNQAYKLAPVLLNAMAQKRVSGEIFTGVWHDVGTPERYRLAGGDLSIES
jgi:MurNAc alpha-1-phosphate uridylyltransferase